MKYIPPLFALLCFVAIGFKLSELSDQADENRKAALWEDKFYQEAMEYAKDGNKNIIFVFDAPRCSQKRTLDVYSSPEVVKIKKDFVWVFLNTTKNQARFLSKTYNVFTVPTYVIIDSDGNIKDKFIGEPAARDFANKLKSTLKPTSS